MQMAENQKEIEFETIQKQMKMSPEEVEDFIIDGMLFTIISNILMSLNLKFIVLTHS